MSLTAEQIQENWNTYIGYIEKYINEPRKKKVLAMMTELEEIAVLAPASSKKSYHNAFPGGYIDHINRVVKASIEMAKVWKSLGGDLGFTAEELIFAALFHDLGKLGNGLAPGYLPQTDNWRKDKLGEIYTPNPEIDFMLVPDRSLFLLQRYGVPVSQNEYIAIRVHDGVYDEANKAYYISYQESARFKSSIAYILHSADLFASKIEYQLNSK
jgi:hypothetical protein